MSNKAWWAVCILVWLTAAYLISPSLFGFLRDLIPVLSGALIMWAFLSGKIVSKRQAERMRRENDN